MNPNSAPTCRGSSPAVHSHAIATARSRRGTGGDLSGRAGCRAHQPRVPSQEPSARKSWGERQTPEGGSPPRDPPPLEDDPPPPKRIGSHARASQPPERWSRLLRPRAHLAACSKVRGGVGRGWGGRGGKYETMGVVANRKEYGSGERERVERKSREREKERESRE